MQDIINAIINNGAAVGLLIYFVFRDYKYINNLTTAVTTLQLTVDELRKDIETIRTERSMLNADNITLF